MKPKINHTSFGSISVDDKEYDFDILIDLKGHVNKRKKKLSKEIYGTSHMLSKEEIKYAFEENSDELIIGSGQYGMVKLSDEAESYLKKKRCKPVILPTPEAISYWNKHEGKAVGLFHITC
jgi:hypothetical protein